MAWPDTAAFLACAFAAEVVGTMAGFGAATVLTPVAALFMDMKTAIALVAVFHLFGNASRLVYFGRQINWRVWAMFGLAAITCSVLGAGLTAALPSAALLFAFGLFLLLYVGVSVRFGERLRLPVAQGTLLIGGMVSGLIAGLLGTGGAIRSACLLTFGLPPAAYIGTSAAIALIVDATRLPIYLRAHLLPSSWLPLLGALVVVAFAGAWTGQRLVRRLSTTGFRRLVLVLLAVMGAKMLWEGWHGLV